MLHDVGKIGVSAELLRKPGALDPTEEEQMRRHAALGADSSWTCRAWPRWPRRSPRTTNATTGPATRRQTAGDDIPLLGRILAVADAYSAMTLDRPYRKSMSRAQAREELLEAAGTQLDPSWCSGRSSARR